LLGNKRVLFLAIIRDKSRIIALFLSEGDARLVDDPNSRNIDIDVPAVEFA
jgi:hypothetical protein